MAAAIQQPILPTTLTPTSQIRGPAYAHPAQAYVTTALSPRGNSVTAGSYAPIGVRTVVAPGNTQVRTAAVRQSSPYPPVSPHAAATALGPHLNGGSNGATIPYAMNGRTAIAAQHVTGQHTTTTTTVGSYTHPNGSYTSTAAGSLAPRVGSKLGDYAHDVESIQESRVCELLGRTEFPAESDERPEVPSLPTGGQLDPLLLEAQRSKELLVALTASFCNEPPCDAGRRPHGSGTFHGFNPQSYVRKVFSSDAVCKMLAMTQELWGNAPNVVSLTVPADGRLIIVGDTHGQLEDVVWMFFKYGLPSHKNRYLFNGDIVDRGGHALEILLLLMAMKRDCPDAVHISRGNHEDQTCCTSFGFKAEIDSKFGLEGTGGYIFHLLTTILFPLLPFGAVVADEKDGFRALVLHGGVPTRIPGHEGVVKVERLNQMDRKQVTVQKMINQRSVDDHLYFNLLWSDPAAPGERPDLGGQTSGRGNAYTEEEVAAFCAANRLQCVVRSHQVPKANRGFELHAAGKCITVFAASNYCGSQGNRGGVLLCRGKSFMYEGPQPSEHMAPAWPQLAAVVEKHGFDLDENTRHVVSMQMEATLVRPQGPLDSLSVQKVNLPQQQQQQHPPINLAPQQMQMYQQQQQQQQQQQHHLLLAQQQQLLQQQQQLLLQQQHQQKQVASLLESPGLLQQIELFVNEQIVLHKRALFTAFSERDPQHKGRLLLQTLLQCMQSTLTEVPPVWQELARHWELAPVVTYVNFLHRFQVLAELSATSTATHADAFSAMAALRVVISDVRADDLVQTLDGDLNGFVSLEEFQHFLEEWKISIPTWQAAALYEGLVYKLNNRPQVEDVLLAVALISRSTDAGGEDTGWEDVAKTAGETLTRDGGSLVAFFKSCDVDSDGFLSADELVAKLGSALSSMGSFTEDQLRSLVSHMDSQGIANGRISLIEFLRALGPRALAKELSGLLLQEVLKPIFFYKTMLEAYFQRFDPGSNNFVTNKQFEKGLREMNRQLVTDGGSELSDYQLQAIIEIASGGSEQVHYRAFLRSLKIADMVKRERLVKFGQESLRSFFGSYTTA